MKTKVKRFCVFGVIALLGAAAAVLVTAAVITSHNIKAEYLTANSDDNAVMANAKADNSFYVETTEKFDFENELEPQINEVVSQAKSFCGGEWSVYVYVPCTDSALEINNIKVQAASVIKLFIMGAVYDDYDEITKKYGKRETDELIEKMITVSSNESADELVFMIGRSNAAKGQKAINEYCKRIGFESTSMNRMMGDNNDKSDNYTSAKDAGMFLNMVLSGSLPHSDEMMEYLKNQTRKNKIPDGVPKNVMTANKTGELEDVENDAAIIFADEPYILCVMSDGVNDYQPPIDAIADISTVVYNYIAPRLSY